ncbi:Rpn family recombination-promoting nuclease/putative transposase [Lactobacillus sp.]|uniref:Rpn family recombination-promoting nuclease/putative transposase n=1 Tax=Lactobacillus sp. TaxID=1591 RepID=UPI0019886FA7|nr:Rpn family recombination-promoting nuclease/putative transposase [Lactobacillus sp.]MBD5429148.1 Rpn family recombination-promoting nuclease/putative transposase [Lactobacillus sp.]
MRPQIIKVDQHDDGKWRDFSSDVVFGEIMSNKKFCKFVLQTILPQIEITKISYLQKQDKKGNPDTESKDIILDIFVKDVEGRLYDVEMQVANEYNLGLRMRYYQSLIDLDSLNKGDTYLDLKESFIIFLCVFDPYDQKKLKYSFHEYEDSDKSLQLQTNSSKIIINSKGKLQSENVNLADLAKFINGEDTHNPYFKEAEEEIVLMNTDPKRRGIMLARERRNNELRAEGIEEGTNKTLLSFIANSKKEGLDDKQILKNIQTFIPDVLEVINIDRVKKMIQTVK